MELCFNYGGAGEWLKAVEVADKVIALVEETQRQSEPFGWGFNVYAALCSGYGVAMAHLGDLEKGEALCEKGLRYALEINDLYAIGFVQTLCSYACWLRGDGEKVMERSRNAIKYLEETQFLTLMGSSWFNLGLGHYLLGQPGAALECMEKGLEIQRSVGMSQTLSGEYCMEAQVLLDAGSLEEAQSRAEESLKVALNNNETTNAANARVTLGAILGRSDPSKSGDAEDDILQGIKTLDEQKAKWCSCQACLYLGELYADTGQREKAVKALKKAEAEFKDMGADYWLRRTQEVLARVEK
jgi:tetratricopeptide (TPR) repeat protein